MYKARISAALTKAYWQQFGCHLGWALKVGVSWTQLLSNFRRDQSSTAFLAILNIRRCLSPLLPNGLQVFTSLFLKASKCNP